MTSPLGEEYAALQLPRKFDLYPVCYLAVNRGAESSAHTTLLIGRELRCRSILLCVS